MKSKRERFETIAANRVHKAIVLLDSLSKCSNKYNYEYNKADVDKMFRELKNALDKCEKSFRVGIDDRKERFKF